MKIVIISTGFNRGGAERIISEKISHFLAKGFFVDLVLLTNSDKEFDLPRMENFGVLRLNLRKNPISLILGLLRLHKNLQSITGKFIVFSHMIHANIFACLLKMLNRNRYTVCVAHNTIEGRGSILRLYIFLSRYCDRFIQVSKEGANKYISQGFHNGKVEVIRNGLDSKRFEYHPISPIEKNGVVKLVAVGRLTHQKNYPMLIDAIRLLVDDGVKVHLAIFGEGPLKARLQEKIDKNNLSSVISLSGFSNDPRKIYHKRNIFILSSDYEGFGLVLAEAMLTGLPCIATDCGGVREVGSKFVRYIDVGDSMSLKKAILTTCELHFRDLQKISLNGREWIEQNFLMEGMLAEYEEILLDI